MNKEDGRKLSMSALNERRRRTVKLCLSGMIEETEMGTWKKIDERTRAGSMLSGALTFGALGGGKTYTFKNLETGEIKTITAGGYLGDGYELTDEELGRRIANGEFDEV